MKISIDLGHECSPYDIGADGNISEQEIIDAVGSLVIFKLKNLGNTVIETRPNSCISVGNSLWQRYNKSDDNKSDWCISIHANASDNLTANGVEIFTYGGKEIYEARQILNNIASIGFCNRGIKDGSNLAMVHRPQAKSMLIEICFCTNENDCNLYRNNIENIANAIVNGLVGSSLQNTKYSVGWNNDDYGWFYSSDGTDFYSNCWNQIVDSTDSSISYYYYFDNNGYILTNKWKKDENDKWYYLDQNGNMVQARTPEIVKWKNIGGKYYCFATDGSLYQDCTTNDGYTVNKNGEWETSIPQK